LRIRELPGAFVRDDGVTRLPPSEESATTSEVTGLRSAPPTEYEGTVTFMTRTCARPGCGDAAVATFGYDYANQTVFLDLLADEAHPAAYDICRRHADNLSAPRGWTLLDRRRGPASLAGHLTGL